ncbi:hypothetical protein, partial [Streptomyces sp. NPDC089919]|uniref:hypothetical protein n=1 Tax=Streptomyces sp. NPDC089919 TaxID=3155188 RepID=UPI00343D3F7C
GTSTHRSESGYQLLALIFGTLLSSQGADASFVLTLAGFPPGASFVLAFPTLSDLSGPDFLGAFRFQSLSRLFPSGVSDSIRSFRA